MEENLEMKAMLVHILQNQATNTQVTKLKLMEKTVYED
jgi:hypothetical protein